MQQDKINQPAAIKTGNIIFGMILMFIIVHIGFHATYIKEFPVFQKYNWLHHIHGALMGSWVMLLLVQPILIHKKKFAAHRFLGKLSYAIAPCMIVSMVFIARNNYETGILKKSAADVMATQSITWMQIVMFILFYSLAIYCRKNTYNHMRFMIATAIIMLGPPINRIIVSYFPDVPIPYIFLISLYVKTAVAAALFLSDLVKKKYLMPGLIVLSTFLFSDVVFHARYSDAWQAVGKFIVNTFY
ncbi:MAG: hypothetical protein IPN43_18335 [Chitinophagaceae bacterium]|nr:hypothetical protein [Chitinophagaceae bacterium]MBK8788386.1 hypothetical protein [Chitinophagaceae bacterium]MBL0202146.1 hypothetical protein [Chitinophagaceae bacterium]